MYHLVCQAPLYLCGCLGFPLPGPEPLRSPSRVVEIKGQLVAGPRSVSDFPTLPRCSSLTQELEGALNRNLTLGQGAGHHNKHVGGGAQDWHVTGHATLSRSQVSKPEMSSLDQEDKD